MAILRDILASLLILSLSLVAKIECGNKLSTQTVNADDPNLFNTMHENAIELLEHDVARNTIVKFLNDVKEIMDNKTAFEILTGVSGTSKVIFIHEIGHKTVKALSNGVTKILVDENTSKSIKSGVQGIENIVSLDNTLKLVELEHATFKDLLKLKQTPQAISMIGSGLKRLIEQEGINKAIKNAFINLTSIVQKL